MNDSPQIVSLAYLNVHGLGRGQHKAPAISNFLSSYPLDIFFLSETWLIESPFCPFTHPIFDIRRPPSINGRGNGGLLGIAQRRLFHHIKLIEKDPEQRWVILSLSSIIVATVYFNPHCSDSELFKFWERLNDITQQGTIPTFVVGDFNARLGSYSNDTTLNSRGRRLLSLLSTEWQVVPPSHGRWTSGIRRQTLPSDQQHEHLRTGTGNGSGIPDHLIVSQSALPLLEDYYIEPIAPVETDHLPLVFTITIPHVLPKAPFCRWHTVALQRPETRTLFHTHLQASSTAFINHMDSVAALLEDEEAPTPASHERQRVIDEAYDLFVSSIHDALYKSCGRISFSCGKAWYLSDEIETLHKEVLTLSRQLFSIHADAQSSTPSPQALQNLQRKRKQLFKLHQEAKKVHKNTVNDALASPNAYSALAKKVSSLVHRLRPKNNSLHIQYQQAYINYFNQHSFGNSPTGRINQEVNQTLLSTRPELPFMVDDMFTPARDDIEMALKSLASGKAPGYDDIPNEALKLGRIRIAQMLEKLFRWCIRLATIPKQWQTAKVALIYKKGDPANIANYRPISLTSSVRRVFERCIASPIQELDSLLLAAQGGFRPRRSTYLQILQLHNIFRNHPRAVHAFLDIKAAYDTVDRRLLWHRLSTKFSLPTGYIRCLRALFDYNHSTLLLSGSISNPIANHRGLLQGSSLSPYLFNLFIEDLIETLDCCPKLETNGTQSNCLFFADDGALHARNSATMQQLLSVCET
jgi:Reverse transcriptase (RNA-dependent DNA polymerase)